MIKQRRVNRLNQTKKIGWEKKIIYKNINKNKKVMEPSSKPTKYERLKSEKKKT